MKKIYVCIDVEESGKRFAYVSYISEYENIAAKFNDNRIISATWFPSKAKAEEMSDFLNAKYSRAGIYKFGKFGLDSEEYTEYVKRNRIARGFLT